MKGIQYLVRGELSKQGTQPFGIGTRDTIAHPVHMHQMTVMWRINDVDPVVDGGES